MDEGSLQYQIDTYLAKNSKVYLHDAYETEETESIRLELQSNYDDILDVNTVVQFNDLHETRSPLELSLSRFEFIHLSR